ncbi:ornithine cyclodeaminase [Gulosibacter molinativorax]|uniref:Ornithine cyclodeaminase n=2 Tax=Gulosibacter molinativorax TaxID=256821 RepID=A0ABT7C5Y4_9MICO|nr:ornithine cyclodeaminase [Gulosibacter molinativorax]
MTMRDTSLQLRYLSEPELIGLGATDISRCTDVMCEVFSLLATGDYRMGGPNHSSHGIKVDFPLDPVFPGMPKHTSDRRFMAMPAYVGGKYRATGLKWYGSNIENAQRALPRSMHLVVLNDTDTGAPIAVMPGNLISAYRTGAVVGAGARYLARPDADSVAVIGPGVINQVAFRAILAARPGITRVFIAARSAASENAQKFVQMIRSEYPQVEQIEVVDSIRSAVAAADIVTVAATGLAGAENYPTFEGSWLRPGAYVAATSNIEVDTAFLRTGSRNVVDHTPLYEAYVANFTRPYHERLGALGVKYQDMLLDGELTSADIVEFGDVVDGRAPGYDSTRPSFFSIGGIPAEDVAWATELLWEAERRGVGTVLPIWDQPTLL